MTPNIEELHAILDYIEAHPEEWDQHYYASKSECGTAFCFAGHAAFRAGWKPSLGRQSTTTLSCYRRFKVRQISGVASEYLGLTVEQSVLLFSAVNTLEDLKLIVKRIEVGEL